MVSIAEVKDSFKRNQKGNERNREKNLPFILHGCTRIFYLDKKTLRCGSWLVTF